jgi:hypothetical protein
LVQLAANVMSVSGKIRLSAYLLSYLSSGGLKWLGMIAILRPLVVKQKVFAQGDAEASKAQWRKVADQLCPKLPKLAAFMDEVLSYMDFPAAHRPKLHSANPLERLNGEVPQQGRNHPSGRRNPARAER